MAAPGGFDEKQWGSKGGRVCKYQKFGTKNKYQFNFFLLKRKDGNLRVCAQHVRKGGNFFRFLEGALSSVGFWLGFFLSLSSFLRAKGSREKIQGVQRGVFNLYAPLYFRRCFGQIKNYKIFRMRDAVQRVTTSYCRPRFPLALPCVLFFHFFSLRKYSRTVF